MMTTADIVIDTEGRPILVLPKALSNGQTILNVYDKGFDITVDGNAEVKMDDIEEEFLMTLGLHRKVGIAVQKQGDEMPDTIEYVADVKLKLA